MKSGGQNTAALIAAAVAAALAEVEIAPLPILPDTGCPTPAEVQAAQSNPFTPSYS